MAYHVTTNKEECHAQLLQLVEAFIAQREVYQQSGYNEAQLRVDFISPLLKTFGWDVDNEAGYTQFLREVIQEEAIEVTEADALTKKNPDYTLRTQGQRKLFVEAKKVAVDIQHSVRSAFQARRYGWSANLGISVLTNFDQLAVYDCRHQPKSTDAATVARYRFYHFNDFLVQFDELYELLSNESVSSGYLDEYFSLHAPDLTTFDEVFLKQIEKWRLLLANNLIEANPGLDEEVINMLIQRLLNRIVFLRICEDRDIEKYETLKQIKDYEGLKALFLNSDKKYNSGLFDFIEDHLALEINLNAELLVSIFNELYYPESPYDFSVVDPAILGQIYERYLGSRIVKHENGTIELIQEPEVAASSGVVPTPKLIVRRIVRETLDPLVEGKSLAELQQLKIADICCGSGTFLIALYDYLLEKITLAASASKQRDNHLFLKDHEGNYQLTLKGRREIMLNHIYGVDINPYAVEVTKFSLFLKLLEQQTGASVDHFLKSYEGKILPSLDQNIKTGNSLIDETYFEFDEAAIANDELLYKVKPFDWQTEFPFLTSTSGFDAIVGNPPYVRIQNMVKYLAEEIRYYQAKLSGYSVAQSETFDKYYLFIQRGIQLLKAEGRLGYIVPNKFFIVKGGKALRQVIASNNAISKIIHFGVTQVFPNRSTYTAIVILSKAAHDQFAFKRVKNLSRELLGDAANYRHYECVNFTEEPWIFLSDETQAVFDRLNGEGTVRLNTIAEVTVGVQTSADKIYIFKPTAATATTYRFNYKGTEWEVEKSICKPCIYDLSFELCDTIDANAMMIFPYAISDKAEVFSEQVMARDFPLAWAYLSSHREALAKRSINGSKEPKWYQFGRSQSLIKFQTKDKLIWPVLSSEASYVFDQQHLLFTGGGNGPYYSLISHGLYSPLYFLAILSHPLFEAMVKAGASEFRGAYYSHGKQFVEKLPLRTIDFTNAAEVKIHAQIVQNVSQIIATKANFATENNPAKKTVHGRKIAYLKRALVEKVNVLYGITDEDIDLALRDQIFITDFEE